MKLTYRILWFEDHEDSFDSFREGIAGRLRVDGFELDARLVQETVHDEHELKDIVGKLGAFEPDLLLVDLNLNEQKGNELAVIVRRVFRHTELVFYSWEAAKVLRQKMAEVEVDGVYCVTRGQLADEAYGVIKTTIKKVLDLTHMRGIVMTSVADMDHIIEECFRALHASVTVEQQPAFANHIAKKLEERVKEENKAVAKLQGKTIDELLELAIFGSDRKLHRLREELRSRTDLTAECELLDRYSEDVLKVRNILAHAKDEIREGKKVLRGRARQGIGEEIFFGEEEMRELRKTLLKHQSNLESLLKMLRFQK